MVGDMMILVSDSGVPSCFFWNNQTIIVEGGFTTVGLTKKTWFLCSRQPSGNLEGSRK